MSEVETETVETPPVTETPTETVETPPVTETPTETPETPPKFAGKYSDDAAALKGVNEARKTMGLDEIETLYGEGGLYADRSAAERGYKELTTLMRGRKPPTEEESAPLELGGDTEEEPFTPAKILELAELNIEDLAVQYAENGQLTDEQYAAIRKADPGLKNVKTSVLKALVDTAAKGMIADQEKAVAARAQIRSEAAGLVGGEDNLNALLGGAKSFVPADEIEDMQERLSDPKRFKGAIRDLKEFHAASVGAGKSQPLAGGGAPGGQSGAKDATEYHRLVRLAGDGDAAAHRKIEATSRETIQKWQKHATY